METRANLDRAIGIPGRRILYRFFFHLLYELRKFTFIVFGILIFNMGVSAQGRSDFFDNYDYSLRNYQGGKTISSDGYQEYQLPRPRKKVSIPQPKNVRQTPDPSLVVPPPAGLRRSTNATGGTQLPDVSSLPVNPITGDLNVEAILKNQEAKREKQAQTKKARESRAGELYSESTFRRSEIIFFTTFPFAVLGSAATALLINQFADGFYKSNAGAAFVVAGAVGLSLGNVHLDRVKVEEWERENRARVLNSVRPNIEMSFTFFQRDF